MSLTCCYGNSTFRRLELLVKYIASKCHSLFFFFFFKAFTVVTVFNSMTFALKVTPFSVKSLSEASVSVDRFKVSSPLVLQF